MDYCKKPIQTGVKCYRRAHRRYSSVRVLMVGLLMVGLTQLARAGEFSIHDIETRFDSTAMAVEARLAWQLNDTVIDALHNGIPVTLSATIDMAKPRRLLPDSPLASWRFDHYLSYHSLSHRYLLNSPFSEEDQSFDMLEDALKAAGKLRFRTELVSETLPESPAGYALTLKSFLDINALPAPLRVIAIVNPRWRLNSDVHRWIAVP